MQIHAATLREKQSVKNGEHESAALKSSRLPSTLFVQKAKQPTERVKIQLVGRILWIGAAHLPPLDYHEADTRGIKGGNQYASSVDRCNKLCRGKREPQTHGQVRVYFPGRVSFARLYLFQRMAGETGVAAMSQGQLVPFGDAPSRKPGSSFSSRSPFFFPAPSATVRADCDPPVSLLPPNFTVNSVV